eukprot:m.167082 g.167082  ORF g.167082 m.167082 type:complete len:613 (+) comp18183_c0_seq1:142-1980(+)
MAIDLLSPDDDLSALTVVKIKSHLRALDSPVSGKKSELVERLRTCLHEQCVSVQDSAPEKMATRKAVYGNDSLHATASESDTKKNTAHGDKRDVVQPEALPTSSRCRTCGVVAGVLFTLNALITVALVGGPMEMFEVLEPNWQPALPWPPPGHTSLQGRRVLVTGANRGYGKAIATHLASMGAHVVLHCRDESSCARATQDVIAAASSGIKKHGNFVSFKTADLSALDAVQGLANAFATAGLRIDILVLNAAMVDPTGAKVPGTTIAKMFAVNYLANVVLVRELLTQGVVRPKTGNEVDRPRVVLISSGTYARGTPDVFGVREAWTPLDAMAKYGQTKFLLQTWGEALRTHTAGLDVVVHSPGPIYTNLGKEHVPAVLLPSYTLMKEVLFPSPLTASKPVVALAVPSLYKSGTFLHIRVDHTSRLLPTVLAPDTQAWVLNHTVDVLRELHYNVRDPRALVRIPVPDTADYIRTPHTSGDLRAAGAAHSTEDPDATDESHPEAGIATVGAAESTTAALDAMPTAVDAQWRSLQAFDSDICMDSMGQSPGSVVGAYRCHGEGGMEAHVSNMTPSPFNAVFMPCAVVVAYMWVQNGDMVHTLLYGNTICESKGST